MRVTGAASCLSRRGRVGCFSAGLLDFDFAGDALPEALVEPELLDELDDRDDDPLLDDDLDLLPDELSDPLCHTVTQHTLHAVSEQCENSPVVMTTRSLADGPFSMTGPAP